MVIGKRGSEKYYIIISFILGLLVLGIGLTLIFDIGKNDNLDFEACRNSIIIRANTPKASFADLDLLQLKDSYPLKCKTNVINVEEKDVKNIEKIMGDSLAECWALFGNGDYEVFPAGIIEKTAICVPCARIHFTEEAKQKLSDENKEILVREILDSRMAQNYNYYSYLRDSGTLTRPDSTPLRRFINVEALGVGFIKNSSPSNKNSPLEAGSNAGNCFPESLK